MSMRDVWRRVADERVALADELGGLAPADWERESRCRGWRVRDVVGHLVYLAEATHPGWALDTIRYGRGVAVNGALDVTARRMGAAEPAALLDRLRAASGGRFRAPGAPPSSSSGSRATTAPRSSRRASACSSTPTTTRRRRRGRSSASPTTFSATPTSTGVSWTRR